MLLNRREGRKELASYLRVTEDRWLVKGALGPLQKTLASYIVEAKTGDILNYVGCAVGGILKP